MYEGNNNNQPMAPPMHDPNYPQPGYQPPPPQQFPNQPPNPNMAYSPPPPLGMPQNGNQGYNHPNLTKNVNQQWIGHTVNGFNGGYMGTTLEAMRGVYIKQKTDWSEAVTGIEKANQYKVGDIDNKKHTLFKAKEKSSFCARNCLSGACRPFDVKVKDKRSDRTVLYFERDFSCTCYCLNRPEMKINAVNEANEEVYIGKIVDPFDCCNYQFAICDENDELIYTLTTPSCQLAFMCKCPCEECVRVEFKLLDSQGNEVSKTKRKGKGCAKNAMTDADVFQVYFTEEMPWNHRALLMACMLFVDFRLFEEDSENNNQRHDD